MSPASFSRRQLISRASDLLEEWTGFALRDTSPQRIAETFGRRARQLGYADPKAYLEALDNLPPTADEPQQLVNVITNGLTAFWRDTPQLSALRSLLHHLEGPAGSVEPIYLWCAGVSTGEEAYTVAMIADEESVDVSILGTDVNTEFIDTARRGIYSDWSLRRLDPSRRHTYLSPVDSNHWSADHAAFDNVRFAHHNVLDTPPRSDHPDGRWDIVLCRNVLIYFSADATSRALQNLADVLAADGYLMFGSSEQIHPERLGPEAPSLRPIRQGGGFLYRPGQSSTGRTIEPGSWNPDDPPDAGQLPAIPRSNNLSNLEETTSDVSESDTVVDLLDTTAEHLEDGQLDLALACLEAALGYDPFHIESHCLMGTVLQSQGATKQAVEAFQKALFLEPDHWYAAHRSASIHESRGDAEPARRAHRRTLDGLNKARDPVDNTRVLHRVIGATARVRQQARRSAEEFLRLHGSTS